MRIGYFADGPWAHNALEALVAKKYEISFIVPRFDTQDPVLKRHAAKLGVPFLTDKNVNSPDFLAALRKFDAELFVSMSFNQIVKPDLRQLAPKGFINCHAGALPFYRGRNILNWALINGETEFGITVHYIDDGIDTGDIIIQDFVPIASADDYSTLLKKAYLQCPESLVKAVDLIAQNRAKPRKQSEIHAVGTYFGLRRQGDEVLDWAQTSERIFNFIRAITLPGPCARAWIDGNEFAILRSTLIPNAPEYVSTVGEVVGRNDSGCVVKSLNSSILITEIAPVLNGAPDLANAGTPRWKIGTRLAKLP